MRIIWFLKAAWDKAPDRTTWVEMSRHLAHNGHIVEIVTTYDKHKGPTYDNVTIHFLRSIRIRFVRTITFTVAAFCHLYFSLRKSRYDVVILDGYTWYLSIFIDLLAKIGIRVPRTILDFRTTLHGFSGSETSIYDKALKINTISALWYNRLFQSGLSAIVPALLDEFKRLGARTDGRTCVWSSGVDTKVFTPSEEEHTWDDRPVTFIYHGVFGGNRGLLESIDGFASAKKQGLQFRYVLLGSGPIGEVIRGRVKSNDLEGSVEFMEEVPHSSVPNILRRTDVGVMVYPNINYWRFNHPIKLCEYLASGLPVLVTDTAVFDFVAEKDERCLVRVKDNSPSSIAEGIRWCITHQNYLRSIGREGRNIVIARFTWKKQAEVLEKFITSI